jgi:SAM-dependent methyltransferase
MKDVDRDAYVARYTDRLERFGKSPEALGWGSAGREHVRFAVLADALRTVGARSVLDVGCGFADFHEYLVASGLTVSYRGIDIVPRLLEEARRRRPGLDLAEADIAAYPVTPENRFDAVVASGVFNARLAGEDNLAHIERSVTRMFELAERVVCVDFMTTHVDFQRPEAWHTDPRWAIDLARRLSRRWSLRNDYMPFEFALTIHRDDGHPGNLFRGYGHSDAKNGR